MSTRTGPALASVGDLDAVDATARNPLGTIVAGADGSTYIYLQGAAGIAANAAVVYNPSTFLAALLASGSVGPVAVAKAAIVASKYGWFQVRGVTPIINKGAVTINTQLYIANSSGSLDSTYVAGAQVHTALAVTSSTAVDVSGSATAYINFPWANAHSDS